jgi:hypothetical protein
MTFFTPIYRCDATAEKLLDHLGLTFQKPAYQERALVVAGSFLFAAKQIFEENWSNAQPTHLGWPHNANYWSKYPAVGGKIIKSVRDALEECQLIRKIPETGKSVFDDDGNKLKDIATLYSIDLRLYREFRLLDATYSDPHKTAANVSAEENYNTKKNRKDAKLPSPKLIDKQCRNLFRGDWAKAKKRIERINAFYTENPLVLPSGFRCSSVTRTFSEGRLDAGGRLYGAYSNSSQEDRIRSTIDGEAVCEIDMRASQPTLLSILLGYNFGTNWGDVYSLLPIVQNASDPADRAVKRDQVKLVIAELIGVGNGHKMNPSEELIAEGIEEFLFLEISQDARSSIPALTEMKAKGITGNGYLTFHESEIVIKTIEELIALRIPAYSVHDSIIVRDTDQKEAIRVLRETWSSYCISEGDLNGTAMIYPSLSITDKNMSETNIDGYFN